MSVSTEHNTKGEFAVLAAQPRNVQVLKPSPDEGVRLVRAFVSISSPERRQAVLEYVVEQARMDKRLGVPKSCIS